MCGIGEQPDSVNFGDEGSNTIASISKSKNFDINMMRKMGLFNINDIGFESPVVSPISAYCKLTEQSLRKRYNNRSFRNSWIYYKKATTNISKWFSRKYNS